MNCCASLCHATKTQEKTSLLNLIGFYYEKCTAECKNSNLKELEKQIIWQKKAIIEMNKLF